MKRKLADVTNKLELLYNGIATHKVRIIHGSFICDDFPTSIQPKFKCLLFNFCVVAITANVGLTARNSESYSTG